MMVTPSRVCGLKQQAFRPGGTGAKSHTLAGVWIEAGYVTDAEGIAVVTPSRVCGLKRKIESVIQWTTMSHPRGCVD